MSEQHARYSETGAETHLVYPCAGLYIGEVGSTTVVRTLCWPRYDRLTGDCSPPSWAGAASEPDHVALTTHHKHRQAPPGIVVLLVQVHV